MLEPTHMLIATLTALALFSAIVHIRAEYRGPRYRVYVFKPLTMLFIILLAILLKRPGDSLYKYAIIAGLLCSFAGDIFLMLPSDKFIPGLVSFLIAHLFYITAFVPRTGVDFSYWPLAPFVLYGIVTFRILSPHLGKMRVPVVVYMLVILTMGWQAWERLVRTGQTGALLAAVGAVLFIVSDTSLAMNRFRSQFHNAQVLTLGTYFAAQWFIALSVQQGAAF